MGVKEFIVIWYQTMQIKLKPHLSFVEMHLLSCHFKLCMYVTGEIMLATLSAGLHWITCDKFNPINTIWLLQSRLDKKLLQLHFCKLV